jgi:hypothetical protein
MSDLIEKQADNGQLTNPNGEGTRDIVIYRLPSQISVHIPLLALGDTTTAHNLSATRFATGNVAVSTEEDECRYV